MVRTARLGLVAAFVLAVGVAFAGAAQASHSWSKYHWARTANPFTLKLGDNVTNTFANWDSHLGRTSNDWNGLPDGDPDSAGYPKVLQTTVVTSGKDPVTCPPTSGRTEVCNAGYGDNGWLGLAQIWITRGAHIAQGTAKMNDYYWDPAVGYAYANEFMALHVMCQEVAHTFGLGHQSEDGSSQDSCMDYYRSTNETSTTPNAHDFEQLAKIYKHLDRFSSVAKESPTTAAWARGHAPDGTPFGASPERGRWYVEDLGNGQLLFSHVYWK